MLPSRYYIVTTDILGCYHRGISLLPLIYYIVTIEVLYYLVLFIVLLVEQVL